MEDGRPQGRAMMMGGAYVPILMLLSDGPMTENGIREHVAYRSMLEALTDLEQAGWIRKVFGEIGFGRTRRTSSVGRWELTEAGRKVSAALSSAGDMMELLDRGGSSWNVGMGKE